MTVRCCRCKKITGVVSDGTMKTTHTYQPCSDCLQRDQLIREKGAAIRAQQAAKAGRN